MTVSDHRREKRRILRLAERDHAERTRVPDRLKPTKETAAKLRPDPIERMHDRGTISDDQRDAAIEIRRIFEAVCGSLISRSRWPDGMGVKGNWRRDLVGVSDRVAILHSDRYKPWANELGRHAPALEVTISVVVDGRSLKELDRDYRRRDGWAASIVQDALGRYVAIKRGKHRARPSASSPSVEAVA
jgi:hypothetical protein